jgi:hypothetical protein
VIRRLREFWNRDYIEPLDYSDPYELAVCYVYWWFKAGLETVDWWFRVEDLRGVIGELVERAYDRQIQKDLDTIFSSGKRASRARRYPTWDEIEYTRYGCKLRDLAVHCGYG